MTSAEVISMNECGSLTQHTERPNQRMIMENLWASLSVAHRRYCWLLLFHSSSQSAECGDSKKMESGWCLFTTKEVQSIQILGSGAAWLTAHPVPMISQGRSWKSSALSHVTGLRVEEHTRQRMTTGCQGKCNWAGGDSKAKIPFFSDATGSRVEALQFHTSLTGQTQFQFSELQLQGSLSYNQPLSVECKGSGVRGQMLVSGVFYSIVPSECVIPQLLCGEKGTKCISAAWCQHQTLLAFCWCNTEWVIPFTVSIR